MGAEQRPDWRDAAESLIDWWIEAGLDTLVDERPRDWLAPLRPVAAPLPVAESVPPADWEAFAAWRRSGAVPETGWPGEWVAASGPAHAAVMVLTDCPDRDDAGGTLLSGTPGRLFDRMLAAIGLARDDVHLAAVCAKRPVAGRLPPEASERLSEIALHHAALVRPKVLLLLGNAASRAVLAMDARDARGRLHSLNPSDAQVGTNQPPPGTVVIASLHPRFLLERPIAKAEAWADLRALRRALAG